MKARLVMVDDCFRLLSCNGKISQLTIDEAYTFLTHYDDSQYYIGQGTWDDSVVTMKRYSGETVATVNDNAVLCVENADLYRSIIECHHANLDDYLTVAEYAEKYGRKIGIIRRFCREGRLPGTVLKGQSWLIPKDCPYPKDERK